jgi:hypothetical protein
MIAVALALTLWLQGAPAVPLGAVTGQLRAPDGAPAIGVWVAALPLPANNAIPADGPQYYSPPVPVSETMTDNQGRYRLGNIPPGRYHIIAGVIGDGTYYPAAANTAAATLITVNPGATTPNLDFRLLKPFGRKLGGHVKPSNSGAQIITLVGGKLDDVLQAPVGQDGAFDFGHIPEGAYSIGLFPTPPGFASLPVTLGATDIPSLDVVLPPTHAVTGKIVVQNGPLPRALLEFSSPQGYLAGATINPDLTFSARLQAARHRVELAGMPVGYSIASVRVGSQDATQALVVGNADISNVVITVAAPRTLPRARGKVSGVSNDRLSSAKVELTGPIVGKVETQVRPDGSFEFAALTPGMYSLRLPQVPEFSSIPLVMTWNDAEVEVPVKAR